MIGSSQLFDILENISVMANSIQIKQDAKRFQQCRSLDEVATLLQTSSSKIGLFCAHPRYHIYNIKKANGKSRLIEDPVQPAKLILRRLNDYLQACYHALRPRCVHGFSICSGAEEERNIVSNAMQHIGKPWLLNIDFRDFFHTIRFEQVHSIWQQHFKKFNRQLAVSLTQFTCFNNRLPMGSPTSPVLSNYASLGLDAELAQLCSNCGINYTRFADDCSFSSNQEIDSNSIRLIRDTIISHQFIINEDKVVLYKPGEEKMVTGIVVGQSEVSLPAVYLVRIQNEIQRLKDTLMVEVRYQTGMSLKKLKLFEQELRGKINYAQMVLGHTAETAQLVSSFEEALHPAEAYESSDWLDIPYNFY